MVSGLLITCPFVVTITFQRCKTLALPLPTSTVGYALFKSVLFLVAPLRKVGSE